MKKILKFLRILLLSSLGVLFVIYIGFRIKEYFVGNNYVEYLKNNKTKISTQNGSIKFKELLPELYSKNIILLGEIHEVEASQKIDFSLFKHLNKNNNTNIYLAEMDLAQAYYLNKFIQGITDLDLKTILKKWVVYIGRYNKDYYEKWDNFKKYYSSIPDKQKFEIKGVEQITDFELLYKLLNQELNSYKIKIPIKKRELIEWGKNELPKIIKINQDEMELDKINLLNNIYFNLAKYDLKTSRDEQMYQNFKRYYIDNEWENKKIYGCFGFYHTLAGEKNTFAGKLKHNELSLKENIVSMNILYLNSHLTVLNENLPKFLRDKGKYTRFSFSYDNMLTMYIVGIEDFKRVTKKNSINLFKLDSDNSPYKKSRRGFKNFSILPIWNGIKMKNKKTVATDYIQYVFIVRNADWSEPFDDDK